MKFDFDADWVQTLHMAFSNQFSGQPDALGPVTEGVPKKLRSPRLSKPGVVEFAAPPKPDFSFNLKPADIAKHLNRFVIGQREAKKVLSVALSRRTFWSAR